MRWMYRGLPTLATVVVAAASFALSYVALRDVAIEVEAVPAYLAWLVPVVIDGGVIGASAVIWSAAAQGRTREILPFFVVATLVVISVIVNTAHAGDAVLAKVIAGLPPLVLLASLELVASQYRRDTSNDAAGPAAATPRQSEHRAPSQATPAPRPATAPISPDVTENPPPAMSASARPLVAPASQAERPTLTLNVPDADDDMDLSAWENEFSEEQAVKIPVPVAEPASTPSMNGSRRRTPRVAAIPPADA